MLNPSRLLLWFAVLATVHVAATGAEENVTHMRADVAVGDWLVDDATGRIFATAAEQDFVLEFDSDTGTESRRFQVGLRPRQLALKGRRLVVGIEDGPSLAIINLDTNKVEGSTTLEGEGPFDVACSKAENSFVYAVCMEPPVVLQVDIAERRVRGRKPSHNWMLSNPTHFVMSVDGRYALTDARRETSPSGAALTLVDEADFEFSAVTNYHESFGPLVAGPSGRFWLLGNQLFPRKLPVQPEPLREFAGAPAAIHPDLDLVVSLTQDRRQWVLVFQSFTTSETFTRLPLAQVPEDIRETLKKRRTFCDGATLQFDAPRKRLFFGWADAASVISLDGVAFPKQPQVILRHPATETVEVGQTLRCSLNLTNAEAQKQAQFDLADGPAEAKMDGNVFVWAPTAHDVGHHRFSVHAKVGGAADQVFFDVHVVSPHVALGFVARHAAAQLSGDYAAVGGLPPGSTVLDPDGYEVAVIDLEGFKVVARRQWKGDVTALHIDEDSVYVAASNGKWLHKLAITDLGDRSKTSLSAPCVEIASIPGNRIVVTTESDVSCFSTDLERLPMPAGQPTRFKVADAEFGAERDVPEFVRRLNDGVLLNGVVLDLEEGQPCLLVQCLELLSATNFGELHQVSDPMWGRRTEHMPHRWSRTTDSFGLFAATNHREPLFRWHGYNSSVVLTELPMVVSAELEPREDDTLVEKFHGYDYERKLAISFRDLTEGEALDQRPLSDRPVPNELQRRLNGSIMIPLICDAGQRVIIAYWDQLFVVTIPRPADDSLPHPVWIAKRQSQLEAKASALVELTFTAHGGSGDKTIAATSEAGGVSVGSNGKVAVDTPAIWNVFLDQAAARIYHEDDRRDLNDQIDASQAAYERLFARKTSDVPLRVDLSILATDSEGQSDVLSCFLVLLGPAKELDARLDRAKEERRLAFEAARRKREMAKDHSRGMLARTTGADLSLSHGAPKRVIRIETKLSALTEAINEMNVNLEKAAVKNETRHGGQPQRTQLTDQLYQLSQHAERVASTYDRGSQLLRYTTIVLVCNLCCLMLLSGALVRLIQKRRAKT